MNWKKKIKTANCIGIKHILLLQKWTFTEVWENQVPRQEKYKLFRVNFSYHNLTQISVWFALYALLQ